MSVTGGPDISTDGLILCLDAGNKNSYPGSGNTWYDLSGYNNHGTLTNGASFNGANKGSISFDGSDDYVGGGDTSAVNGHNSICVWFKATGAPSNNDSSGAILFAQSSNFNHGILIGNSYLSERIIYGIVINQPIVTPNNSVSNGDVHFVVGLWNGSQQQIWVDGELLASRSYTNSPVLVDPAYRVGKWGYGGFTRNLNGNIYSVQLYNRALTADEVSKNFNVTKGRYGL